MLQSVPEVAEADATGLVAELFQDIREVTGARLVNLVWRHLASDAAVLEWAWRAVRPQLQSGYFPERARQLRAQVQDAVLSWPAVNAAHSDLSPGDAAAALAVVQTYSHTNCLNMMALSWLLRPVSASKSSSKSASESASTSASRSASEDLRLSLVGAASSMPDRPSYTHHAKNFERSAASAPSALPDLPDLPPLPAWKQLDPGTLLAIENLNLMAESGTPHVVASLYRHLALWPPVLAMAAQTLAPLQQAGLLLAERIATAHRADALLDQAPPAPNAAPAAFNARFAPFLQQLRSVTIAKMIPIGGLLQQLLEQLLQQRLAQQPQQHCEPASPAFERNTLTPAPITTIKPQA